MPRQRKIVYWVLAIVALVIVIMIARALGVSSKQVAAGQMLPIVLNEPKELAALAAGIKIKTVSDNLNLSPQKDADAEPNLEPFKQLQSLLVESYPNAHKVLERTIINGGSIVYRWPAKKTIDTSVAGETEQEALVGTEIASSVDSGIENSKPKNSRPKGSGSEDSILENTRSEDLSPEDSNTKKPILFLAHSDVVPVDMAREAEWEHPPFAGTIDAGYLWGRGTLDFKVGIFAQLAAVDNLVLAGYAPDRDIYFAYGHDEELMSDQGAAKIVEYFSNKGVQFSVAIDEGSAISQGIVSTVQAPLALVGIAEKATLTLELVVDTDGGHSSMPPSETAIGILSQAVTKLEASPMPAKESIPAEAMFDAMAAEVGWLNRLALSNRWLLGGFVHKQLLKNPVGAAVLRTTAAVTQFKAGIKSNVLAKRAVAVVNLRLLPGTTQLEVVQYVQRAIDDPRVYVVVVPEVAPGMQRVSDPSSLQFLQLAKVIRTVWSDAVVAPGLAVATMDARHYEQLADQVFRFAPLVMRPGDPERLHGINERIGTSDYITAIRFYMQAYKEMAGLAVHKVHKAHKAQSSAASWP